MDNDSQSLTVSVIVPVYNGNRTLESCLRAIASSDYPNYELVVVDDSSTDDTSEIARRFSARLISLTGGPYGPAYARNRGAEVAEGDIVFFVDADVVIYPDTVSRVAETFVRKPDISAMFGSYDDTPEAGDFSSQFKNLFHHFVHQQGQEQAVTFWSGCGAVKREVFLESGGFDSERYARPSIEDIELGYRLTAAGHKIAVNKEVQVKHLKRWTLRDMVKADIFYRAIPWTQLILKEKDLPNDLNLGLSQRASALLLCVLLVHLIWTALLHNLVILLPLAGLFFVVVGYWNWNQEDLPPLRGMSRRAEKIMYVLMAATAGMSLYFDRPLMLLPIGLLLLGTLAGRHFGRLNRLFRNLLFVTLLLGIAGAFAILVVNFSFWLLLPIFGLIATIVVLNMRFYFFFLRKRGVMFTVAVVPFHLLYYLYSIVTFTLVTGIYTVNSNLKR
jgi:glycosyltransferase involved in cell wall biosynthesis